jgi:hypothetical protein
LGISAGHIVVGLTAIERGTDQRLQCLELRTSGGRYTAADLRAGVVERIQGRERVAHHGVDVERAERLI